jgi:hypothetical protein
MAHFTDGIAVNSYQPGTTEFRLNLDPATGRTRFAVGSVEYTEIQPFLAEYNPHSSPIERERARAKRFADEAEAVQAAIATGIVPNGFTPIAHADRSASMSTGHRIGDSGVCLVRTAQVDVASSMGFRPVAMPAS